MSPSAPSRKTLKTTPVFSGLLPYEPNLMFLDTLSLLSCKASHQVTKWFLNHMRH